MSCVPPCLRGHLVVTSPTEFLCVSLILLRVDLVCSNVYVYTVCSRCFCAEYHGDDSTRNDIESLS